MSRDRKKIKQTPVSQAKAPGAAIKPPGKVPPAAAASTTGTSNREDWVQLSFRVPPAVDEFVTMTYVKRKITFQTLMLTLLHEFGAPISDADLEDNRKGRKASSSGKTACQALPSKPSARCRDGITALEQLRDPRFWEQIAQQGNGQPTGQSPSTLQVIFANFVGDKAR